MHCKKSFNLAKFMGREQDEARDILSKEVRPEADMSMLDMSHGHLKTGMLRLRLEAIPSWLLKLEAILLSCAFNANI